MDDPRGFVLSLSVAVAMMDGVEQVIANRTAVKGAKSGERGRVMTMGSLEFSEAARQMAQTIRTEGYRVPTFRSPPRHPGQTRSIRRRADGSATIAVALRGRTSAAVLADMIDGVVAANELAGIQAGTLRDSLWETISMLFLPQGAERFSGLSVVGSHPADQHQSNHHREAA